jgi:predicted dehydrogenase
VRIGVLGLGQRGLQHLRALWQLQNQGLVQVVALGDAFESNLVADKIRGYVPDFRADGIQHTTDFSTLLDAQLDALYICLPPNVHNGEVVAAAAAGIHLFVEKPMSLFLDEALEMERAIERSGVISTVGFQQRFDVRYEAVHDFMRDRQPVMACYTMHAPLEAHNVKHTQTEKSGGPSNRVWTANRAWSGMTVVEGGIHPLDLWRYWFGNVAWVQATYVHRPPEEIFDGADNPYAYAVTFGFENGAVGTMTLSRLRKVYSRSTDHQVLWNEGRLALEGDEVAAYHYGGDYPPATTPSLDQVRHVLDLPDKRDITLAIARAFVEAILHEDPSRIRSPFPDAMNSLAAVLAANVSDELDGVRVSIDELLTAEQYARFRQRGA